MEPSGAIDGDGGIPGIARSPSDLLLAGETIENNPALMSLTAGFAARISLTRHLAEITLAESRDAYRR